MLDSFPVSLAVATVLGFFAGLGVGGGSVLMVYLTLLLGLPYEESRIYNLLFFLPAAAIATFFQRRQGNLELKKIAPGVIAGCVSAAVLSVLRAYLPTDIIRRLFGILLIVTAIRELTYKPHT